MSREYDMKDIAEKILALKDLAKKLKESSGGIQSIDRNVDRILSSIRLLELEIVEVEDILNEK